MPRILPLFLLLAHLGVSAQPDLPDPQTTERYPFQSLGVPDTLLTSAAVEELQRRCDVVHGNDLSFTAAGDPSPNELRVVLLKKWDQRWLVYGIAQTSVREGYSAVGPIWENRYFALTTSASNIILGRVREQHDLVLVDPVRATYAAITTYAYDYQWEPVEATEEVVAMVMKDTTSVHFTRTSAIVIHRCSVNGVEAPCAEKNGSYSFTPDALVLDTTIDIAPAVIAPPTYAPILKRDTFPFRAMDRLCPKYYTDHPGVTPLSVEDRIRFLQEDAPRYVNSELYLFAELEHSARPVITILCTNNDDHDLLWLQYDEAGKLIGLDTLASHYGDGQESTQECAYYDDDGVLVTEAIHEETLRDGNDTMAYLLDTLVYARWVRAKGFQLDGSGEVQERPGLICDPKDVTRRWVECHAVNDRGPYTWHSLRALIPPDRRVLQAASGDLDRDGAADHVFVLTDRIDNGDRDLLIVFTAPDRCGFVQHALLPGFLPDRASGGFHDPIGEEGLSGISIHNDSLMIAQFGGSAWKWQSRATYVYDATRNAFSLVEQRDRSYHATTVDTLDEELQELEATRDQWDVERTERYAELKKMSACAEWKVERYVAGDRPMAP